MNYSLLNGFLEGQSHCSGILTASTASCQKTIFAVGSVSSMPYNMDGGKIMNAGKSFGGVNYVFMGLLEDKVCSVSLILFRRVLDSLRLQVVVLAFFLVD